MADHPQQTVTRTAHPPAQSGNLADVLERVLDKGIVIAGDIKLLLAEVEVLTLQIRLVVCSVDKAREIGLDWWRGHPAFGPYENTALSAKPVAARETVPTPVSPATAPAEDIERRLEREAELEKQLERLERSLVVEPGTLKP